MTTFPQTRSLRCVFAHDHIFVERQGKFASRSGLPHSVLARYADAFGEVDVICRSRTEAESTVPLIIDPRVHFYPMRNVRSLEGLREIGQVASAISKIVKRADCVIARLPSVIGLLSAAASVRHGKPLAVEVVGNAWEANIYHGARIGPIIAPIEHLICKAFVKRAKISIYITTDYLQRVYPTKGHVFVCPNVQIDEIVPADRVKGRLVKSASSKWIFGLVGSLDVSYKGHETAITALAKLKQSLPQADLRLQFAGGGDPARWERLAIAAGVSENVDFLGTISPGEPMRRWYDSVDIVMQPSQVEAQGRAIIEAMSRGKPVVATRTGGIPELISEDCLVRVADANELAERTSALVRNSAHYEAIALRNLTASRAFLKPAIERQRKKAFDCLRTQIDSVN